MNTYMSARLGTKAMRGEAYVLGKWSKQVPSIGRGPSDRLGRGVGQARCTLDSIDACVGLLLNFGSIEPPSLHGSFNQSQHLLSPTHPTCTSPCPLWKPNRDGDVFLSSE